MLKRHDAINVIAGLISGQLSRDEASNWAGEQIESDAEVTDLALWDVVKEIAAADLKGPGDVYLVGLDDYLDWLRTLSTTRHVEAAIEGGLAEGGPSAGATAQPLDAVGLVTITNGAKIAGVDDAACVLLARARRNLVGMEVAELLLLRDRRALPEAWQSFLSVGRAVGRCIVALTTGYERPVAFVGRSLPSTSSLHVFVFTSIKSPGDVESCRIVGSELRVGGNLEPLLRSRLDRAAGW